MNKQSLHVIHESKRIHGDIKPLNIMKLHSGSMILIDLDASVAFGTYCGSKVSSAYLPPEMILLNPEEDEAGKPTSKNFAQELKASASFDMWALGVTLYHLCTGSTLWKADVQDNLDDYRDMKVNKEYLSHLIILLLFAKSMKNFVSKAYSICQ